jgi:hypothetical protein
VIDRFNFGLVLETARRVVASNPTFGKALTVYLLAHQSAKFSQSFRHFSEIVVVANHIGSLASGMTVVSVLDFMAAAPVLVAMITKQS